MALSQLTRHSVLKAIEEYDVLGPAAFLAKYGFKESKKYKILFREGVYDSKAICGAAHQHVMSGMGPLKPADFSGGAATVGEVLRRLGFVVANREPEMSVIGSDGTPIKSTCEVEGLDGFWSITLHSRGGKKGTVNERNPEYKRGLATLVERLQVSESVIHDVLLDSAKASTLPVSERRLVSGVPLRLGFDISSSDFIKSLTAKMIKTASKAKSGGNPTKQIRIIFSAASLLSRESVISEIIRGGRARRNMFVLTWNPDKSSIEINEHIERVQKTAQGEIVREQWSTGNRKSGIEIGDDLILFRQISDRGIVGLGTAVSQIWQGDHWDGSGDVANFVDVDWKDWLHIDERIRIDELRELAPSTQWDNLQASGIQIEPGDAEAIRMTWGIGQFGQPSSQSGDEAVGGLVEGAKTTVAVNRYERNRRARKLCVEHFGAKCQVCDIDFGARYGGIGEGFIHVHHITPIASIGATYKLDPLTDLVPVCPNCHAIIHFGVDEPRTIASVRDLLGMTM